MNYRTATFIEFLIYFQSKYVAYIENGLTWVLFYLDRKYERLHQRKIARKHKLHIVIPYRLETSKCDVFLFLTNCTLAGFFHQIVLNSYKDMYNSPIVYAKTSHVHAQQINLLSENAVARGITICVPKSRPSVFI
jgi:hypothetical protein